MKRLENTSKKRKLNASNTLKQISGKTKISYLFETAKENIF